MRCNNHSSVRFRGRHHAVVPSSGSSFPRHWAWSQGGVPCAPPAWNGDAKARCASGERRVAQRVASGPSGCTQPHAGRETELVSTLSPGRRRGIRAKEADISRSYAPDVARHPPRTSTGYGAATERMLPAVAPTSSHAMARREPRTRERPWRLSGLSLAGVQGRSPAALRAAHEAHQSPLIDAGREGPGLRGRPGLHPGLSSVAPAGLSMKRIGCSRTLQGAPFRMDHRLRRGRSTQAEACGYRKSTLSVRRFKANARE